MARIEFKSKNLEVKRKGKGKINEYPFIPFLLIFYKEGR